MQPTDPTQPPVQQPQYPPQTQGPFYQPPPTPLPLPGHKLRNILIVAVIVVVALAAIGYYVVVIYPQPNIVLTDALWSVSGCGFLGPSAYTFTWTFTLVNAGSADGFATVTAYLNGAAWGSVQYFVLHGTQVDKSFSIDSPDCSPYTPDIGISSVTKA